MKETKSYYDEFSHWYDRERNRGYHAFIDRMEYETIEAYCRGKAVLEAGCGTGLIMEKIAPIAASIHGIDISRGMLQSSLQRGLKISAGSITDLPFKDNAFDTVYSVKVLAHIPDLSKAISELVRVTKPEGMSSRILQ